jgi:muramoyltetrapeptide carboxypeptidase LdcA involved in peptidoglycan recycling
MHLLQSGDHVAIVSPSSTIAGVFTWVFEQGLDRMRKVFQLKPVVMPHALNTNATQADRASDLHSAFSDSSIKAVFSCTGGVNQNQLIPSLDGDVFRRNPKPFFGYSDNTNLCNFLYAHDVKSFYGGSVLSQFAMQHAMCDETVESLKWALFRPHDWFEIKAPKNCIDEDHPWEDKKFLTLSRNTEPNTEGLLFDGQQTAQGTIWGGCLETLSDLLRIPKRWPNNFSDKILFLETSEELPHHEFVRRFLVSIGEAGILSSIKGLIVARPKAWFFTNPMIEPAKSGYRRKQMETILAVMRSYNTHAPVVMNVSIGHTDPQLLLPFGGYAKIEPVQKKFCVKL